MLINHHEGSLSTHTPSNMQELLHTFNTSIYIYIYTNISIFQNILPSTDQCPDHMSLRYAE